MARNMRYDHLIETDGGNELWRRRNNRACFAGIGWIEGKLLQLNWDFDHGSGITVDEFKQLITHFFTTGEQYGIQFEFGETYTDDPLVTKKENGDLYDGKNPWTPVIFTNLGDYPRSLFMNKLFMIRNLGRYPHHYIVYKKMVEAGIPFPVAAYLGANFAPNGGLVGNGYRLITYAESIWSNRTIAEIRNAAYCRHDLMDHKGKPWKLRGGYNNVCNGIARDGRTTSKTLKVVNKGDASFWNNKAFDGLIKLVAAKRHHKKIFEV